MAPSTSYAQNGEDVVLARAFRGQSRGTYVDVGAGHPVDDSVTYALYRRGWRGVNIEPNPVLYLELERERPDDRNLNVGVSETSGHLTFWQAEAAGWGRSTFSEAAARQLEAEGLTVHAMPISVTSLADVLSTIEAPVDFVKIDVEGFEAEVIAGAGLDRFPARVLLIEIVDPGTGRRRRQRWEPLVAAAGYEETLFDGVNVFYVHHTARHLAPALSVPANVTDDFELWRHKKALLANDQYLELARRIVARDLAASVRAGTGEPQDATPDLEKAIHAVLSDTPELVTRMTAPLADVLAIDVAGPAGSHLPRAVRKDVARLREQHGDLEVPVQARPVSPQE